MENKITFNGVDSKKSDTKKENVKKIIIRIVNIFCYIATIFLAILLIVSFTYKPNKSQVNIPHPLNRKVDNIQLVEDNPSYVSYDDGEEEITLNYNEISTYSWNNLVETIIQNELFDSITLVYSITSIDGFNQFDNQFVFEEQIIDDSIVYANSDNNGTNLFAYIDFDLQNGNKLVLRYENPNQHYGFISNENLLLAIGSDSYSTIKNAIQLDIEQNTNPTISIFEGITSSVTNFIITLNSGITAIIGIFWANSSLTPIGILTTIVVGVSIVYFLFRLVIGLIRLRG